MKLEVMSLIINLFLVFFFPISLFLNTSTSQPVPPPTPSSYCDGVYLSYAYNRGYPIPPLNAPNQVFRFESTLTIVNNGLHELKSWRAFVGFQHEEHLVSAPNAVLADGASFPAFVGSGTVLAGFPDTDIKSTIETAGDMTQTSVRIHLVGTQSGVRDPNVPMPDNIALANDGYSCPLPTFEGKDMMHVCCIEDPNFRSNFPAESQDGDLVITYDVIRTYDTDYWAEVSISNHNPLGRLDNWKLSWEWTRDEFIYGMKGAYPEILDTSKCIFGRQGQYYKNMDFSMALNCERRPTILDLPPSKANDTNVGRIPFCCRNGTILPRHMDSTKSRSVFQMHVHKMPPDVNRTKLIPPLNWKINGTLNPGYQCGNPVPVSPSMFPDSSGLPTESTAIASWKIVCNISVSRQESPRCCVSFSAFFNDSAIPCNTCACGCDNNPSRTCGVTEPALLVPFDALLVPFDNRTLQTLEWADIKGLRVPNPLPCGDNCGVSINWHLLTDYKGGWTARITLFNWGETNFADWFASVQLDKAVPGFEDAYSFNGTTLPGSNNTIFLQGLKDSNYLMGETDGAKPRKDPRVPGKQQTVISFTTKNTPNIRVAKEDGFPTKVIFNGEECSLPAILPSNGNKMDVSSSLFGIITLLAFLLMYFVPLC